MELSKSIRDSKGKCEVCGSIKTLQVHHLIPRFAYKSKYRFDPNNLICLCAVCHKWGCKSFHRNSVVSSEWLRTHKPEQYNWVLEECNKNN